MKDKKREDKTAAVTTTIIMLYASQLLSINYTRAISSFYDYLHVNISFQGNVH